MSKILLVDDDADLAVMIQKKLSSDGHEVQTLHTGQGAFETAKNFKPDIALLDIMLPEVTGYQICRRIRRDPELYGMAVMMLTALGEEPEVTHGIEQGADDYLVKPFKLETLTSKIQQMNRLLKTAGNVNSVTGLPGTEAVKREVNHRLARGSTIAVCYIDIVNFKPFVAAKGPDAQRAALEFTARLIATTVRSAGIYESFISHIGGDHFVVVLSFEDVERFCNVLTEQFDQKVQELYTPDEARQGFIRATDRRGTEGKYPLMVLAIGVAHNRQREFKNAQKLFEVLTQLSKVNSPDGKSSVFVDRRTTNR